MRRRRTHPGLSVMGVGHIALAFSGLPAKVSIECRTDTPTPARAENTLLRLTPPAPAIAHPRSRRDIPTLQGSGRRGASPCPLTRASDARESRFRLRARLAFRLWVRLRFPSRPRFLIPVALAARGFGCWFRWRSRLAAHGFGHLLTTAKPSRILNRLSGTVTR